ncbi:hypothetical protein BH09CHL1_BH09CHL1_30250 [soil metagenome]
MNSNVKPAKPQSTTNDAVPNAISKIPEFASKEEEAEFWDAHDFTEFTDETEPVEIIFGGSIRGPIDQIVAFRLEPDERHELKRMADEAGESVSEFAHKLVSQQLRQKTA